MCSPTVVTPNSTATISRKCSSPERRVSFMVSPEIFTVERLDLSFYGSADYKRFRQETLEEQREKYAPRSRDSLADKRRKGYQMLTQRRNQRLKGRECSQASMSSMQAMRSHLSIKVAASPAATVGCQ